MYKLWDLECEDCGAIVEELLKDDEMEPCTCGSLNRKKLPATLRTNTMNLLSKEEYSKKMMERSAAHTAKELKQNGIPQQNRNNIKSIT